MTSKNLFCKLVRQNFSQNLWALALSALGFLFCLPLAAAMMLQNYAEQYPNALPRYAASNVTGLLSADNFFAKAGIAIMAVLCGVALFRYLHASRQVDFHHALPVRRGTQFAARFLTGVALVLPAYLLMHLLTVAVAAGFGYAECLIWSEIIKAMAINCVFFLLLYSISVLCTVLTGNTVLAVLLDGWALLSLPALPLLIEAYKGSFYQTYVEPSSFISLLINRLSPVVQYFAMRKDGTVAEFFFGNFAEGWSVFVPNILAALLVALGVTALAQYLFRIRRSESAGSAIAFEWVKLPLKIYMTLVAALGFGMFLHSMLNEFWMWFGLVAGTVITHCIVEIIYQFDFKALFRHLPAMASVCVVAVLCVVGVRADFFGYDRYVPVADDVASCNLDINGYNNYGNNGGLYNSGKNDLTTPENINRIVRLAELGADEVSNRAEDEGYEWNKYLDYQIVFRLDSGRVVSRHYQILKENTAEAQKLMREILFTGEYRRRAAIFRISPENKLEVSVMNGLEKTATLDSVQNREQLEQLLDAVRQDMLTLTDEQAQTTYPVFVLNLEERQGDNSYVSYESYPIYPSYTHSVALLDEYFGLKPEKLSFDRVLSITLENDSYTKQAAAKSAVLTNQSAAITDPLEIALLLEKAVPSVLWNVADISMQAEDYYATADVSTDTGSLRTQIQLYYPKGTFPQQILEKYGK